MLESIARTGQHDGAGAVHAIRDHSASRAAGPRLERLFQATCDWLAVHQRFDQLALDSRHATLTYHELDSQANRVAHYLLARGARPGDRIGVLLDHGADCCIAMLAVLKIRAAYVPLDPSFPAERIEYIAAETRMSLLLSVSSLVHRVPARRHSNVDVVFFDATEEIIRYATTRLETPDPDGPLDDVASVIYPSRATGRPQGVEITHASICNFGLAAAKIYGISTRDRVYESMSAAGDRSAEGIWVAWMAGATLVAKPAGPTLSGPQLRQYLTRHSVSALYCLPAQLAALHGEVTGLQFVVVSGEPCPSDLLARWVRPGRRVLSVYGHTDATTAPQPTPKAALATADLVQVSDGHVTVHMTPDDYEHTPHNQLRRLLID
jgi:non-ribosomal peptide synthetase component F